MMNMFALAPRKLNVVSSELAYKNKLVAFGMRFFGGIQANRETRSMRFMDTAAEVIRNGKLVQIFPEAKITDDGTVKPFKHSYIVIAHRANAPIIPIVTDGNYGFAKRASIIVGKPIYVSDYVKTDRRTPTREELETVNEVIYSKVVFLRQELELRKTESKKKK